MLLDTHALHWLVSGAKPLSNEALVAIGESQAAGALFVSPITAWELSIAAQKPPQRDPPRLNSSLSSWFRAALSATSAKLVPIGQKIAIEAAEIPVASGHKDSGDGYLIATSRIRNIPLVTREASLRKLAIAGYLVVTVGSRPRLAGIRRSLNDSKVGAARSSPPTLTVRTSRPTDRGCA